MLKRTMHIFLKELKSVVRVQVTFIEKDGGERTVKAAVGQDLLSLAHSNEIDLEGIWACLLPLIGCLF